LYKLLHIGTPVLVIGCRVSVYRGGKLKRPVFDRRCPGDRIHVAYEDSDHVVLVKKLRYNFADVDGSRRTAAVKILYENEKAPLPSCRAGD
jgi:hypothetical protein